MEREGALFYREEAENFAPSSNYNLTKRAEGRLFHDYNREEGFLVLISTVIT